MEKRGKFPSICLPYRRVGTPGEPVQRMARGCLHTSVHLTRQHPFSPQPFAPLRVAAVTGEPCVRPPTQVTPRGVNNWWAFMPVTEPQDSQIRTRHLGGWGTVPRFYTGDGYNGGVCS